MPLPRSITRFNRTVLNRVLGPPARYLPAFGVLVHRGRTSGRVYRTPVNVFRQPDGYVIALTYGVGDWARNILAAGGCVLVTRGRSHRMTRPRLVHDARRSAVPPILRLVGAVGNVSDFLYLAFEAPPPRRATPSRVPAWVPYFNPVMRLFLAAGVPMGAETLLTVRGRKTGLPRSTPVAVAEIGGTRWLLSPFGATDWARNLRAAGRATLTAGRRTEPVVAVELGRAERVAFFRDVLNPYLQAHPLAAWIVRTVDRIGDDAVVAADGCIVFALRRDGPGPRRSE